MTDPAQLLHNSNVPRLIALEREWRRPPSPDSVLSGGILASRWVDESGVNREVAVTHGADYHTICLALRFTTLELEVDGRRAHSGPVALGMVQISEPAAQVSGVLCDRSDFLHFGVPTGLLTARCQELGLTHCYNAHFADDCGFRTDAVIAKLTQALLATQASLGGLHRGYVECIASAIITRLLAKSQAGVTASGPRRACELPKWRLKRAFDYIDAHLAEPIHLGDIAEAAGLSRMHFAAQFRAATGHRPREYLLRQRIDHAKALLAKADQSLADVAFSVGFSNQSHFSTVFGRFVGETPRRWQVANRTANVIVPSGKTAVE